MFRRLMAGFIIILGLVAAIVLFSIQMCKMIYALGSIANAQGANMDGQEYYHEMMMGTEPNPQPLVARERMQTAMNVGLVTCNHPQLAEVFNLFASELSSP